jgi:transposase
MLISSSRRQAVPDGERGLVIGIDISQGRFDWRACQRQGWGKHAQHPQSQAGFLAFEARLQGLVAQGYEVWLGQESTGPYGQCLQEWLLVRGWKLVLVNPYHVHRTKETRDNSPLKDDAKDAGVIADLIWQGQYHEPRRLVGCYGELRAGIGEWYSLAKKRTAVRNEAQALLELWFPEVKQLFGDRLCLSVQSLIRRYQRPSAMVRALRGLLDQLALVEARQQELKGELAQWLDQTQEGKHLLSVPRVGVIIGAGLLGECGPLAEFRNARAVEKFVGLHLCRSASGQRQGKCRLSKRGRSGARSLLGQLAALHTQQGGLGWAWAQARKAQGMAPLAVQ